MKLRLPVYLLSILLSCLSVTYAADKSLDLSGNTKTATWNTTTAWSDGSAWADSDSATVKAAADGSTLSITDETAIAGTNLTLSEGKLTIDSTGTSETTLLNLTGALTLTTGELIFNNVKTTAATATMSGATLSLFAGSTITTMNLTSGTNVLNTAGSTITTLNLNGGSAQLNNGTFGGIYVKTANATTAFDLTGSATVNGSMTMHTGTLNFSENTDVSLKTYLGLGQNGGGAMTLNMNGGKLTVLGHDSHTNSGTTFSIQLGNWGKTSTLNLVSGSILLEDMVILAQGACTGTLHVSGDGFMGAKGIYVNRDTNGSNGVFKLDGGTVVLGANGIRYAPKNSKSSYALNLSGGTLAASADWECALNINLVEGSGAPVNFDTTKYDVNSETQERTQTAATAAQITLSGVLSGSGWLSTSGAGSLVLTSENKHTGGTIVRSGGTLKIASVAALGNGVTTIYRGGNLAATESFASPVLSLDAGKRLDITGTAGSANLSMGLALNTGSMLTVDVDALAGLKGTDTALLAVSGNITSSGVSSFSLSGDFDPLVHTDLDGTYVLATGTLDVASWASGALSTAFLNSSIAQNYTYSVTPEANKLVLTVEKNSGSLFWNLDGGTGIWDTTTSNWRDSSGTAVQFQNGNVVTFGDVGTLPAANTVEVASNIAPGIVTFDNNQDTYVLNQKSGTNGALSGSFTMYKNGTGTVEINMSNPDYTGSVVLSDGKLVLGAANALGTHASINFSGGILGLKNDLYLGKTEGTGDVLVEVGSGLSVTLESTDETLYTHNITKSGDGNLTLNGTSYSGVLTSSTGSIILNTSAATTLTATSKLAGSFVKTGDETLNLTSAAFSNSSGSTLTVEKGTVVLGEGATYSGTLNIHLKGEGTRLNVTGTTTNITGTGTLTMGDQTRLSLVNGNGSSRSNNLSIVLDAGTDGTVRIDGLTYGTINYDKTITGTGNLHIVNDQGNNIFRLRGGWITNSYVGDTSFYSENDKSSSIEYNLNGVVLTEGQTLTPWGTGNVYIGGTDSTYNAKNCSVNFSGLPAAQTTFGFVINNDIFLKASASATTLQIFSGASSSMTLSGRVTADFGGEGGSLTLKGSRELIFAGGLAGNGPLAISLSASATGTRVLAFTGDSSEYTGQLTLTDVQKVRFASQVGSRTFGGSINAGNADFVVAESLQVVDGSLSTGTGNLSISSSSLMSDSNGAALTINGSLSVGEGFTVTLDNSGEGAVIPSSDGKYILLSGQLNGTTYDALAASASWATALDESIRKYYTFSSINDTLYLSVRGLTSLSWTGDASGNGTWSTNAAGWMDGSEQFANSKEAYFTDIAGVASSEITIGTGAGDSVSPGKIIMDAESTDYTWAGEGTIAGTGMLDKSGTGKLTINQKAANTFSGGVTLGGGEIVLVSSGGLGTSSIVLNDGTLTLGSAGDHMLTLGNNQKISFNGGVLNYGTTGNQDISGILDTLSKSAVKICVGGDVSHNVVWTTGLAESGLALEKTGAGMLSIMSGGSMTKNLTVKGGALLLDLGNDSLDISLLKSDAGTRTILKKGTSGATSLTGSFSGFSGELELRSSVSTPGVLTSNNLFNVGGASFDNASKLILDGAAVFFGNASGLANVLVDIEIGDNGAAFHANGGAANGIVLSGVLTGNGMLSGLDDSGIHVTFSGNVSGFAGDMKFSASQMVSFLNSDAEASVLLGQAVELGGGAQYVVNYAGDAELGASVTGSSSLRQSGEGTLTLSGNNTSSGTLTIDGGKEVRLGNGTQDSTWLGSIEGDGTLVVNNAGATDLSRVSGVLNLHVTGTGKAVLNHDTPSSYTGSITVSGGGLDFSSLAYSNTIVVNGGNLHHMENYSGGKNVDVLTSTASDLGNLAGSNIKSLNTKAGGSISGVDGSISLDAATLTLGEANLYTQGNPMALPIVKFNNSSSELNLGALTLNVSSIESFLTTQVDQYYVMLTNGIITGAVTDSDIAFDPYLESLGYRFLGLDRGTVTISGKDVDYPYIVGKDDDKVIRTPDTLSPYPSLFVNGHLTLELEDGQRLVAKELKSDTWATGALIDTGTSSAVTVELKNAVMDTDYAGSMSGAAAIVKTGEFSLDIAGDVSASNLTVQQGALSIGGVLSVSGDLVVEGTSNLSLGRMTEVGGQTIVRDQGELNIGGELATGNLVMSGNTTATLQGGTILLTGTDNSSKLGNSASLKGTGTIVMGEGSSLLLSEGSVLEQGIAIKTGKSWYIDAGSDLSLAGMNGSRQSGLILNEGVTVTIDTDEDAVFEGKLSGEGTLVKLGQGTQLLNLDRSTGLLDQNSIELDVREGGLSIDPAGAAFQNMTVGSVEGSKAVLSLLTDTSARELTVRSGSSLILGATDPELAVASVTLKLEGNASFGQGSTFGMVIPSEKGGLTTTGTISLSREMNLSLINHDSEGWNFPLEDLVIMSAGNGFLDTADNHAIAAGTVMDQWKVSLEKSISLFYSTATVFVGADGKTLLANPVHSDNNKLLDYAQSDTARVGAELLWNAGLQKSGSNLDLILSSIMDDVKAGDASSASHKMAAAAGSTVTSFLGAQQADYRYQQTLLRNRMTTMGLPEGYNYDGELPLWNAWVQATGTYNSLTESGDFAGYKYNTWGGTFGVDTNLSERLTVGLAMSASYGKLTSNGADTLSGDLDIYYANLFARYQKGKWGHNFIVTAGWSDGTVDRTVNYGEGSYTGHGSTSGSTYGAMYEATYDIALNEENNAIFQPLVNVSVMRSEVANYDETGAGNAGLRVSGLEGTSATVSVGGRLMGIVGGNVFGRESLGELRVQVAQDLGDTRSEGNVGFLSNPGFSRKVKGNKAGTTGLQFGAGLSLPSGDQGTIFVDATADIRSGMTSASGSIGYRYNF